MVYPTTLMAVGPFSATCLNNSISQIPSPVSASGKRNINHWRLLCRKGNGPGFAARKATSRDGVEAVTADHALSRLATTASSRGAAAGGASIFRDGECLRTELPGHRLG